MNRLQALVLSSRFTRSVREPLVIALLFLAIPSAYAAPIHYNIQFAPGVVATPTGSFDYDASLAPAQQFSNFEVTWLTDVFNFTNSANAFAFRTDAGLFATSCAGSPGVNDAFELLTSAPCVASVATTFQWGAAHSISGNTHVFEFRAISGTPNPAVDGFTAQLLLPSTHAALRDSGDGYLAAVPTTPVPEPASLLLLGTGLMAGVRRWRKGRAVERLPGCGRARPARLRYPSGLRQHPIALAAGHGLNDDPSVDRPRSSHVRGDRRAAAAADLLLASVTCPARDRPVHRQRLPEKPLQELSTDGLVAASDPSEQRDMRHKHRGH